MEHKQTARAAILEHLMSIPKFGKGIGLHRMSWFFDQIKDVDSPSFDAIKVTGSNGKGSVCSMLSSLFDRLGIVHGLNTSPHLFNFNERIRFGETEIDETSLLEVVQWFQKIHERFQREYPQDVLGAFEGFSTIALKAFAVRKLEHLIIEAGIGGRYDSTRIIPGKLAALTSLDLEHTQLLGNTLELIAYDKADLCPPDGTLVTYNMEASLAQRLANYCLINHIRMVPAQTRCRVLNRRFQGLRMIVDAEIDGRFVPEIFVNLTGQHQASNVEVSVALLLEWLDTHKNIVFPSHDSLDHAIRHGLQDVKWHGRCSHIHSDPDVFIDVGHSPQAVESAVNTFREIIGDRPILLVTGVSHDKDVVGILKQLLPLSQEVIATRAHHKGSQVADICRIIRQEAPDKPLNAVDPIEKAVHMAVEKARKEEMAVVIAGGLFLSIEAQHALEGHDPKHLKFF